MAKIEMRKATRDELASDSFNWIVGPVIDATIYEGHDVAIVFQGRGAFAVVRPSTKEYKGCCPTEWRAICYANSVAQHGL